MLLELFIKSYYKQITAFLLLASVLIWMILYLFVDTKTFPIEVPYSMIPVIIGTLLFIEINILKFVL